MSLAGLNFDAQYITPQAGLAAVQGRVDWSGEPVVQTRAAHQERIWTLLALRDGTLASGAGDGEVMLWYPDGTAERLYKHAHGVVQILERDEETLVTKSQDKISLLNRERGCIHSFRMDNDITTLRLLKNGNYATASGLFSSTVVIRNPVGEPLHDLPAVYLVCAFLERRDGTFAVGDGNGRIRLSSAEGQLLCAFKGHNGSVTHFIELEDGTLVSGGGDGMVRAWNNTGHCLRTYEGHTARITKIIHLANGIFASASNDQTVRIWNRNSASSTQLTGHTYWVTTLFKLRDGTLVSASGDAREGRSSMIKFWNPQGVCLNTITENDEAIEGLTEVEEGVLAGSVIRISQGREAPGPGDIKFWMFPSLIKA